MFQALPYGVHEESFHGISPVDVMSGELEIQILDYSSQVLRTQFNINYGLHLPSYLYDLEKSRGTCSKIPSHATAVQIHFISGHNLVSALQDRQLYVYDSLYNRAHVLDLIPQLFLLYETNLVDNLQYSCPQRQGYSVLCGFFALENCVNFLLEKPLGGFSFEDSKMRHHLRDCLVNGHFHAFPRRTEHTIDVDEANSLFEIQLQREFARFQGLKKAKFSTQNMRTQTREDNEIGKNVQHLPDKGIIKSKGKMVIDRNRENTAVIPHEVQTKKVPPYEKGSKFKRFNEHTTQQKRDKDKLRQRKYRLSLNEEQKQKKRKEEKLQHQKHRETMDEKEKRKKRQENKLQQQKHRETMDEEEKSKKRQENKLQQQKHRKTMYEEEKSKKRQENKLQQQKHRETMDEEEKEKKRQEDKWKHQKHRETIYE